METVPLSCTTFATCAELQDNFVTTTDPNSAGQVTSDATCTGTTTCNCRATVSITGVVAGMYTTTGTSIAFTADTGTTPTNSSYCVDGDQLHVMTVSSTMTTPM